MSGADFMGAVFNNHVFPKWSKGEVFKDKIEISDEHDRTEFALLDFSFCKKEGAKLDSFENEFIQSFLHAVETLAEKRRDSVCPGAYVVTQYSEVIPVLYLTRHCMELALKQAIRRVGYDPKKTHGLVPLWNSLWSHFPNQRTGEDGRAIKNMGAFVRAIDGVDKDGASLRYPMDRTGSFTQDKPLFVSCDKIAFYLEKFVEQLSELNVEHLA